MKKPQNTTVMTINPHIKLRALPNACYGCGSDCGMGSLTLQSEGYSQRFCTDCLGRALEYATDMFLERKRTRR